MATCPPDCGLCCEQIYLSDSVIARLFDAPLPPLVLVHPEAPGQWLGEDKVFCRDHWTVAETPTRLADVFVQRQADDPTTGRHVTCDAYVDGRCSVYETRPPICSLYPFYGTDPADARRDQPDHNVCAYHDDMPGRRVLPLTVINSG